LGWRPNENEQESQATKKGYTQNLANEEKKRKQGEGKSATPSNLCGGCAQRLAKCRKMKKQEKETS